jgi:hypothetical protein
MTIKSFMLSKTLAPAKPGEQQSEDTTARLLQFMEECQTAL